MPLLIVKRLLPLQALIGITVTIPRNEGAASGCSSCSQGWCLFLRAGVHGFVIRPESLPLIECRAMNIVPQLV